MSGKFLLLKTHNKIEELYNIVENDTIKYVELNFNTKIERDKFFCKVDGYESLTDEEISSGVVFSQEVTDLWDTYEISSVCDL